MAEQTANVVLTADVSGYTSQMAQAEDQTTSFIGKVDSLSDKLSTLSKSTGRGLIFFGTGTLATFGAMTTRAAAFEKQMSTLRATAAATGKDIGGTERSIQKLAIAFPIARSEAVGLYTQLNNLGIKGTKNMEGLATSMVRLGSATGESIGGLTQGFVELSRSMGTLAGGQSQRYANSLYAVSRNAGVAASSVLSFSNAIAPMARVTGMGMTEVMGISTAFTKAGADGMYAANTFSSMLADISRQVQYGSPNIRKYADLIGVTADQFTKMDKTEAVTRIFETIGKSGPEAVKILDRMGYDGIRAAKAITALSNAGGIRSELNKSYAEFNGDDLQKGSDAANKSLATELEQTKDLMDSIGTSIGSGMLGPLREVANVFNKILGTASSLISTLRPLGNVLAPLTALIVGGGALALGSVIKSFGLVSGAATARYFTTTATGSSIAAGFRAGQGYGSEQMRPLTRLGADRYAMSTMLRGGGYTQEANRVMSPVQRMFYTTAQGVGSAFGMPREGGPGVISRVAALPVRLAGALVGWNTQFYRDAIARDPYDRTRLMPSGFMGGWRANANEGGVAGAAGGLVNSFRALGASLSVSAAAIGNSTRAQVGFSTALGGLARSLVQMTIAATRASASLLAMGGMAAVRGAGSMLASLGMNPAMMALLAAGVGFTTWNNDRKRSREMADPDNFSPSMGLQRVNEKLGLTGVETSRSPMSDREKEANLSTPMTAEQAIVFDYRQRAIAEAPGRNYVNQLFEYAQSPSEAAALTRAGGVLTPTQLQQYGFDAMKRFGVENERKYRDEVLQNQNPFDPKAKDPSGVVGTLKMADRMAKDTYAGWWDQALNGTGTFTKWFNQGVYSMTGQGRNASDPIQRISQRKVTKETEATVDEAIAGIGRLINSADKSYSKNVGSQLGIMELDKALAFLADPNTSAGVLSKSIAGIERTFNVKTALKDGKLSDSQYETLAKLPEGKRAEQLREYMFPTGTEEAKQFKETYGRYMGSRAQQEENLRGFLKERTDNPLVADLQSLGKVGELAIDANAGILTRQADPDNVDKEIQKLAVGARNLGGNFGEVITKLQEAAITIGKSNEAVGQAADAAVDFANKLHALDQLSMSRSERRTDNYQIGFNQMRSKEAAARGLGRENVMNQMNSDFNFVRGILETARNYQVGRKRTTEDYNRSVTLSNRDFEKNYGVIDPKTGIASGYKSNGKPSYAQEDFDRSQRLAKENYDLQVRYANEDFTRGREYAQADYNTSRNRFIADFATSQQYSAEDFATSKARSIEAFNRQESRAIEDFNLQRQRAILDHNRQELRAIEDFNLQKARAQADFDKSQARATEDYNTSRSRTIEDFHRNQARAESDFARAQARGTDDFNRSRLRAQEDFDRSMARRAQAAARSIYAPFQRITTLQTMDAANLIMNLDKQNKMIQDQVNNLNKLKDSGLTQQTIDTLGLADSANAQQVARLLSDMQNNPSLINDLNAAADKRLSATGTLVNSDLNVDYRQSQEDFSLSLSRSTEDFRVSLERSVEDFRLSQSRSNDDFQLSLDRMESDFTKNMTRANDDFTLNMSRMSTDFATQLSRSNEDFTRYLEESYTDFMRNIERSRSDFTLQMQYADDDFIKITKRSVSQYELSLDRMAEDFEKISARDLLAFQNSMTRMGEGFDKSTQVAIESYEINRKRATEAHKTMLSDMKVNYDLTISRMKEDLVRAFEDISGNINQLATRAMGILQKEVGSAASNIKAEMQTIIDNWYTAMNYLASTGGLPTAKGDSDQGGSGLTDPKAIPKPPKLAAGGIVTSSVYANVGEAGYPEAIVPLNSRGASFMAMTIKEALSSMYSSPTVYRGERSGVTNVDKSTNFTGAITVQAQDPNEMARRLEEQARLRRLVRAR